MIALVGNPNVGKSTLFNALTGARQAVGNYPGATVEVARGVWHPRDSDSDTVYTVVDLPGTYSLQPQSPDERLTRDLIVDRAREGRPDTVIVVLDASNLTRNLYLFSQVADAGVPVVVALTMGDIAAGRGLAVDSDALTSALGCPVAEVRPRRREGMGALGEAIGRSAVPEPAWLGDPVEAAVSALGPLSRTTALDVLAGTEHVDEGPVSVADVQNQLVDTVGDPLLVDEFTPAEAAETLIAEGRYAWARAVIERCTARSGTERETLTDRVDRVLTRPLTGIPVFLVVMWAVFQATTTLAVPLQETLGGLVAGPVTDALSAPLDALGMTGWAHSLLIDGLVNGVGQLLSFVPLMAIMFVLLALLEDSGYMARAAFVTDRLMEKAGLPGRAFLPLIVGFGCNVPALAGTRVLKRRRDRLLVGLLIPYVTCSARLAVYVLVASVFFGAWAGTAVFAMYLLSILLVVGMGFVFRRTLFRGEEREPLLLELPPYRLPSARVIAAQSWTRLAGFLRTAGGIIVLTVTAVAVLSAVPAPGSGASFGSVPIQDSVFGTIAAFIAPVFALAGFGAWQASAALMTGFVAKEAVVATMAQTYGALQPTDMTQAGSLGDALHATFAQSSGGHTTAAALAFMVFLLAYTPCMATLAEQRSRIGGRLTLIGVGAQLAVAWLLAMLVFQIGCLL
ncbi:ferrous iron transport protein B [Streptomyces fractus]|uniref:ferrous iron transport protein B n=1 Tax=Streptomyces fractus TaxID=641806 RepID=UPI003CF7D48B